ncbi:hypothetical protein [Parasaccharibacter sp. TMW2.1890]|uniref:hypothetical protein n=1 Tax=Parasaccharibacter sp. TMW2.1890 TaxID=2039289 RepID=UPI002012AB6C|nr:hypothetical protein [Parasaccharibacter sp. TMW2.1890]MCL1514732.1 hypothetical protein [Parasaccharibacter sp. TMW2.1890]
MKNEPINTTLSFSPEEETTEILEFSTYLKPGKYDGKNKTYLPFPKDKPKKKADDEEIIRYFILLMKKDPRSLDDFSCSLYDLRPSQKRNTPPNISNEVKIFVEKEYQALLDVLGEEIYQKESQRKYFHPFYNLIRMIPLILSMREKNIEINYFKDYKKEALGVMIFGSGTIKITAKEMDVFEYVLSKVKDHNFTNSRGFIRIPQRIRVPYDMENIIRIIME